MLERVEEERVEVIQLFSLTRRASGGRRPTSKEQARGGGQLLTFDFESQNILDGAIQIHTHTHT